MSTYAGANKVLSEEGYQHPQYIVGKRDYPNSTQFRRTSNNFATVLQKAIDHASSKGGGVVEIEKGRYKIDKSIKMKNGVTIKGQGKGTTVIRDAAIDVFDLNGASYVGFESISINGNNPTMGGSGRGIGGKGKQVKVRNCNFDYWGRQHAVGLKDSFDVVLIDNRIGTTSGFGSEGGCKKISWINNRFFKRGTDYPLMCAGNLKGNEDVVITGNDISRGSTAYGGCIDVVARRAVISNNIMRSGHLHSIYIHSNKHYGGSFECSDIVVTGNTSKGVGSQGSIVIRNDQNAADANIVIANNVLEGNITLNDVYGVTITGNKQDSGTIYCIKSGKIDILGNVISNKGGILVVDPNFTATNDVVISGNSTRNVGQAIIGNAVNSIIVNNIGVQND